MSAEQPYPGCGFLMSPAALAHHYPLAHGPKPLLPPHFHQRDDGIIRCLVTRRDDLTPWSLQGNTHAAPPYRRPASQRSANPKTSPIHSHPWPRCVNQTYQENDSPGQSTTSTPSGRIPSWKSQACPRRHTTESNP